MAAASNVSLSASAFAFKGMSFYCDQAMVVTELWATFVATTAGAALIAGGVYQAALVQLNGVSSTPTISSILATVNLVPTTSLPLGDGLNSLVTVRFRLASSVTLAPGTAYGILIGRTDQTSTYALTSGTTTSVVNISAGSIRGYWGYLVRIAATSLTTGASLDTNSGSMAPNAVGFTWNDPPQGTVTSGSQTFTSGSGSFTVPSYNTLTVEVWGGGSSGVGVVQSVGGTSAHSGGPSSVSTLGLTSGGGTGPAGGASSGAGATGSGGNTSNTQGGTGTYTPVVSSTGGGAANGGASVTLAVSTGSSNGVNGNAPGGGGTSNSDVGNYGCGGPAGGYTKSVYTFGNGPAPGSSVAYSVGAGGAAVVVAAVSGFGTSGAGANGQVKFTWS